MTKIIIIDDHPLYREGVISALSGPPLRASVTGLSAASDAIQLLDDDPTYDLALVDCRLSGEDGLDALRRIGREHPTVARMLISGDESAATIEAAMRAGAQGFLPKSLCIAEMLDAIETVLSGEVFWPARRQSAGRTLANRPAHIESTLELTARQRESLHLLAEGMSNAQIAARLGISERTAKAHLKAVFDSLGVHTRVNALVKARAVGLIG